MKKLALFDLDKTIYNTHSFFQFTDYEVSIGRLPNTITEKIESILAPYKSGIASWSVTAGALLEAFASELKGKKYNDIYMDAINMFEKNSEKFFPYFSEILPNLLATHDVFLITNNAQFVSEAVVHRFGLTGALSSEFEVQDGVFTGRVTRSLANGKSLVAELTNKYGKTGSLAVGDSANDIEMLNLVDHPICINPGKELREYADIHGWEIVDETSIKNIFSKI